MRAAGATTVVLAAIALVAPARAAGPGPVDPLIGTASGGGTFPGATVPFGMVQPSPNTKCAGGGGYHYECPSTWGFGTTHLSGPGCPAMGDVVLLPTSGQVTRTDPRLYASHFSHEREEARPGYYAVVLQRSGVHAELTATARTAWERFTFPRRGTPGVLVAPGAGLRGAFSASVRRTGAASLEGSVGSWGYFLNCPTKSLNRYTVRFRAEFSRPFAAVSAGADGALQPGSGAEGPGAAVHVTFAPSREPLVVKIGISYVSVEGAAHNLAVEAPGFDFDAIRARAERRWRRLLDRVQVSGGSAEQRTVFATALYHSLLHPNLLSDEDGRYVGFDGEVHDAGAVPQYTNFSLWDTYRSEHQLLDLVVPERVPAFVTSLLRDQEQGGWLPKWPYAVFETNEMVGDPAVPVLVDAYLKGLMPEPLADRAYQAMAENATALPPPGSPFLGRPGLGDYLAFGYVPLSGGELRRAVSMTLEYGVADCALSLMARKLGDGLGADILERRARGYRELIHDSGYVWPRDLAGDFVVQGDATRSDTGFAEGTPAQYTWLVPQDVPGLAELLGGSAKTVARLDDFFASGAYAPGNEHDLQAPYLYDYLGAPARTQEVVRGLLRNYRAVPGGIPGNEDLGALSSWYVLSALGLYPAFAGSDVYALTAPLFPRAVVRIGGTEAHSLVIERRGAGLVGSLVVDGEPWSRAWLRDETIRDGAHLVYRLTPGEDHGWGTAPDERPPTACGRDVDASHVAAWFDPRGWATMRAGRESTLTMNVWNDRDIPVTDVAVRLELPDGWMARPLAERVGTLGPGDRRSLVWSVRPPAGFAGNTSVHARLTWSTRDGHSPLMGAPAAQRVSVE